VAVAELERRGHVLVGVLRRDLEDAETELGDLDAVGQRHVRDLEAGSHTRVLTVPDARHTWAVAPALMFAVGMW
jgi:hypothetical protein